jgi:primary-amine oxidase
MRNVLIALVGCVFVFAVEGRADCRSGPAMSVAVREHAIGKDGDFRYVADVKGGQAPYSYAWSVAVGGAEFKSSERQTPIFLPYLERYAEVTVTDRGGCSAKAAIGLPPAVAKKMCNTLSYSPVPTPGALQSAGVEIHFAGGGASWRVALENRGLKGVALGLVQLKRPGDTSWNTILKAAGPSEIFVPYHNGTTRLYDMQWCGASFGNPHPCLRQMTPADSSPVTASQITFPGSAYPTVAVECRDAGVAALCKTNAAGEYGMTTRYKEVVFWSVYDTGNYDYIIEYGFRNDGAITFRAGATGYNNANHVFDPHMHDVVWRVDIDLFGAAGNHVYQLTHSEQSPNLFAVDSDTVYPTEGTFNWTAEEFTAMLIEGSVTNSFGNEIGYELTPWDRKGTARHWGSTETFTQKDFWVTANHPGEDGTGGTSPNDWGTNGSVQPDAYLMRYVSENAGLIPFSGPEWIFGPPKTDIVVWYRSAAHHHPHDEDRQASDGPADMTGLTLMHWQGFDLLPHDLFDYNPLVPANICYPN